MTVYTVKHNGRPLLCRRSSVKPAEFKTYAAAVEWIHRRIEPGAVLTIWQRDGLHSAKVNTITVKA